MWRCQIAVDREVWQIHFWVLVFSFIWASGSAICLNTPTFIPSFFLKTEKKYYSIYISHLSTDEGSGCLVFFIFLKKSFTWNLKLSPSADYEKRSGLILFQYFLPCLCGMLHQMHSCVSGSSCSAKTAADQFEWSHSAFIRAIIDSFYVVFYPEDGTVISTDIPPARLGLVLL